MTFVHPVSDHTNPYLPPAVLVRQVLVDDFHCLSDLDGQLIWIVRYILKGNPRLFHRCSGWKMYSIIYTVASHKSVSGYTVLQWTEQWALNRIWWALIRKPLNINGRDVLID